MSPDSSPQGAVRSSAVVNADIRALMLRAGGWPRTEDRPIYHRLVEEWHQATARERTLGDVVVVA